MNIQVNKSLGILVGLLCVPQLVIGADVSGPLEEVVVTGSRISKSNIDTPIPTQVLDLEEIDAAGSIDLGEILEQIPGVYLGISPGGSLLSTQNAGLSTIDLRSLGTNRTLTLINGRRVVSNSGSAQRVDTSTIPSGFIRRIDITTGGASAIYGSDAIAGVANIVLKDSFEGFTIDTRYGDSDEGGAQTKSVNLTMGMNFDDDKGNIMLGGLWNEKTAVFASDRDFAKSDLEIDLASGELEVNRSSYLPGGRFEGDAWNIGGVWQNDKPGFCIDDGRVPACDDFQSAIDGYDFRPFSMVLPARDRWAVMTKVNYQLTDTISAWASFQYANIETRAQRAAAIAQDAHSFGPFDNKTRIGDMRADHPFIHAAVQETLAGTVDWRRRFVEVGQRFRASERKTQRYSFGLDGDFNENWNWSAYLGYGVHKQQQIRENELNRQKIKFALDIEVDPDNAGDFRCIDSGARADGCVPLDIFGEGSISVGAADYVRATDRLSQKLEQTTASFNVSGVVWDLPAGEAMMAAGIDYRKEEQSTKGDPDTNAGLTTTGFIPDIKGDFDVTEAFVEFNLPLLNNKPGVYALGLATAYRIADYSTIGRVSSWNFGLSYSPIEDLRFRAQVSQAQRAPDITELFSSQRSDFDDVNDPCDNLTAASTGVIADNCRSVAGIAAAIAADGKFEQDSNSIFGPSKGNPDLFEETADTLTYGFVYTPAYLDGFSLIVDYYDIEVEDSISSVDSQLAADLCYADAGFPSNSFCASITRASDGQIERIVNQVQNLNVLISEGVDVTLTYDFSLSALPGEFKVKTLYGYVRANEERFNGPSGEEVDEFAGEVGLPQHEYRFTLSWSDDDLYLRYRANYTGTVVDNLKADPADLGADYNIPFHVTHDLYASYKFGDDHSYRIYAGINNIEDNHGPYLPDGYKHGTNYNINSSYDRLGRNFYAGIRFNW